MSNTIKSTLILFIAAMIWGSAFVAQRAGMDSIGPFYFSALRSFIGAGALCAVFFITDLIGKNKRKLEDKQEIEARQEPDPGQSLEAEQELEADNPQISAAKADAAGTDKEKFAGRTAKDAEKKLLLRGGTICGIVIFFAMNFQQVALVSVDAGKTGFITALYIVIVPLLGIFFGKKVSLLTWAAVALAVAGLYFLCITSGFTIHPTDLLILISSFFWAVHIMCLGHFAPKVNTVKLTAMQFFVAGIISLAVAVFREPISVEAISGAWFTIAYTGVFSTAIGFSLQAFGQKHANTTAAAIIMSTESLFAAISGFLILGETFTPREGLGCLLMFSAVIIAQLPAGRSTSDKSASKIQPAAIKEHMN